MPVRIRLARIGGRRQPIYSINVANSFSKRDGKYIENVGRYSSLPDENGIKRVYLSFSRIKYWLSVGAQPTPIISRLLGMVLP